MNGPEKKILYLAFCFFVLGVVVRLLPWGLPAINHFQVESGFQGLVSEASEISKNEDKVNVSSQRSSIFSEDSSLEISDKEFPKKKKKEKKIKKKVQLPLRINSASAEDLCALNGVGPKLAEKIVAHRDAHGPFKSGVDLKKVPGIGTKKLESILPGVIFD